MCDPVDIILALSRPFAHPTLSQDPFFKDCVPKVDFKLCHSYIITITSIEKFFSTFCLERKVRYVPRKFGV